MSGVPGSSHGGPEVASGALVSVQTPVVGWTGGSSLALDTVEKDTDGYWDAVLHRFIVPAGLDGLFVVSAFLDFAADVTITSAEVEVIVSGAAPNCYGAMAKDIAGANKWRGSAGYVVYLAAADGVNLVSPFSGPATVTVDAGSCFSLARIGSLP